MLARNAVPVRVWQSVQWQMVMELGSTSASKVIRPQWQCQSIFMGLSSRMAGSGRAVGRWGLGKRQRQFRCCSGRADRNMTIRGIDEGVLVEILANTAIKAQLSTLPESDQNSVDSMLKKLAQDTRSVQSNLSKVSTGKNLWELQITSHLRALVRIDEDQIEILAVARPDQLKRYWRPDLAS
jgi:hypothetical protein